MKRNLGKQNFHATVILECCSSDNHTHQPVRPNNNVNMLIRY